MKKKYNRQRGFLGLLFLVLGAVLALAYYSVDLHEVIANALPAIKNSLHQAGKLLSVASTILTEGYARFLATTTSTESATHGILRMVMQTTRRFVTLASDYLTSVK